MPSWKTKNCSFKKWAFFGKKNMLFWKPKCAHKLVERQANNLWAFLAKIQDGWLGLTLFFKYTAPSLLLSASTVFRPPNNSLIISIRFAKPSNPLMGHPSWWDWWWSTCNLTFFCSEKKGAVLKKLVHSSHFLVFEP